MFKITDSRKKIMMLLIRQDKEGSGLSSYSIGNLGIPRRTFEINKEYMIENNLIRVVHSIKAGRQSREYFGITSMGFFILLKNMSLDELKKEMKGKFFCTYFPMIGNYWEKLTEMYGEFIPTMILRMSLNCLEVEPERPMTKSETFLLIL